MARGIYIGGENKTIFVKHENQNVILYEIILVGHFKVTLRDLFYQGQSVPLKTISGTQGYELSPHARPLAVEAFHHSHQLQEEVKYENDYTDTHENMKSMSQLFLQWIYLFDT